MKKTGITLLLLLMLYLVNAQVSVNDLVGNYYVINKHEFLVNDTLEFIRGDIDSTELHFMLWHLNQNNSVNNKISYPLDLSNKEGEIIRKTGFGYNWKFFKETQILNLGEKTFKVLYCNNEKLRVVRMN